MSYFADYILPTAIGIGVFTLLAVLVIGCLSAIAAKLEDKFQRDDAEAEPDIRLRRAA